MLSHSDLVERHACAEAMSSRAPEGLRFVENALLASELRTFLNGRRYACQKATGMAWHAGSTMSGPEGTMPHMGCKSMQASFESRVERRVHLGARI